jgi:hypothetical protein
LWAVCVPSSPLWTALPSANCQSQAKVTTIGTEWTDSWLTEEECRESVVEGEVLWPKGDVESIGPWDWYRFSVWSCVGKIKMYVMYLRTLITCYRLRIVILYYCWLQMICMGLEETAISAAMVMKCTAAVITLLTSSAIVNCD